MVEGTAREALFIGASEGGSCLFEQAAAAREVDRGAVEDLHLRHLGPPGKRPLSHPRP
jgi:hypothetical protein